MSTISKRPQFADVVTRWTVLDILMLADEPLTTFGIRDALCEEHTVPLDEISMSRLRRTLDRLEEHGEIMASGGPKRADLPGWPRGDGRDVWWATVEVADRLTAEYKAQRERQAEREQERVQLLKNLHTVLLPHEREALGLVGVKARLKEDPNYERPGATRYTLPELRVIHDLATSLRGEP